MFLKHVVLKGSVTQFIFFQVGLANKVRPPQEEITFAGRCFVGAGLLVCLFTIVFLLKTLGLYLFPNIFI